MKKFIRKDKETEMPNHCYNELIVNGTQEHIDEVFLFIASGEGDFDFNKIIPYPEHFKQRDDDASATKPTEVAAFIEKYGDRNDGYNSGGYTWCCDNWGTKWNAYEVVRRDYSLFFQTAWAPPKPVIVALAKLFPDVTFHLEFFEHGMEFAGGFTCFGRCDYEEEYEDEPFSAGKVVREWYTNEYKGSKGG